MNGALLWRAMMRAKIETPLAVESAPAAIEPTSLIEPKPKPIRSHWSTPFITGENQIQTALFALSVDPSVADIRLAVARAYGITIAAMVSPSRRAHHVRPRQTAMTMANLMTGRSLSQIGTYFGGRDHTTVLHAVRKYQAVVSAEMSALNIAPRQHRATQPVPRTPRPELVPWTTTQEARVAQMWSEKAKAGDIAIAVGRSKPAVWTRVRKLGLEQRRRKNWPTGTRAETAQAVSPDMTQI